MIKFYSSLFGLAIVNYFLITVIAHPQAQTSTNTDATGKPLPCSKAFSNSLWKYTAKLLQNLQTEAKSEENIFISPVSTYLALSSLSLGAGERTRKDLAKILKLPENNNDKELSDSNLHETLAQVEASLHRSSDEKKSISKTELANGLFVQKDFPIKDSYMKLYKKYYNGNASNIDFTKGDEATNIINKWISEKTLGRIPKLYDQLIDPNTIATLVSTLYFKGQWKHPFSQGLTKAETFNTGSTSMKVPMMNTKRHILYESDPSLQFEAISIPYAGEYSMTILLPYKSQTIKNLTDHLHLLDPLKFSRTAKITHVDYKIPKMKFNWRNSLVSALKMNSILKNPDLSEMTTNKNVKISNIIHMAELEVDEKGTIASATTTTEVLAVSASVPTAEPIKFYVDRPFIIGITHKPTCSVLFSGKVYKPL